MIIKTKNRLYKMILLMVSLLIGLSACGKESPKEKSGEEKTSKNTQSVSEIEVTTEEQAILDYSDRIIPRAEFFDGGDGSEADPFRISTKEQLALLSYYYSKELSDSDRKEYNSHEGLYYLLTEDIYLNDTSDFDNWDVNAPKYIWIPIGYNFSKLNFDGGGHTIYGMYVDMDSVRDYTQVYTGGLFGDLRYAEIKNVNIKQGYICQDYKEGSNNGADIGGVAGSIYESLIENCTVDVRFMVKYASTIGGICGNSGMSVIRGCAFEGEFNLTQDGHFYASVGGIAGSVGTDGMVDSCVNHGELSYTNNTDELYGSAEIGGIVANVSPGLITNYEGSAKVIIRNCINEMTMNLGNLSGAGIVARVGMGCDRASVEIDNCENKADISSASNDGAGGLVYLIFNSEERDGNQSVLIKDSSNSGNISGTSFTGGIVAKVTAKYCQCSINGCKNTGDITSKSENENSESVAGGIIATTEVSTKEQLINACINEGKIECKLGFAGGIIGRYQGFSSIGLGTESAGCKVIECQNSGVVQNESGQLGTGGILGGVISSAPFILIEKCINSGRIGGITETCAGGIVGRSESVYASSEEGGVRISGCVNKGIMFVGVSPKNLTGDEGITKRNQYSDVMESYKKDSNVYVSVNTGSALGGMLGRTRGALVEKSVNICSFEADGDYMVLDSMDDYLFQAELNNLHPGESKPLFVCGIVGGKIKGTTDNEGTLIVKECYYENNCNRGVIDENDYDNETMYDTQSLSHADAETMAEQILSGQ